MVLPMPREDLGYLYRYGGLVSFTLMLSSGRVVDRFSAVMVGGLTVAAQIFVIFFGLRSLPAELATLCGFHRSDVGARHSWCRLNPD